MASPKLNHPFNVMLSDGDIRALQWLADARRTSKAAVIRALILGAYAMDATNIVSCANGARCFMPHLHQTERTSTCRTQPSMNADADSAPPRP